MADSPGGRNRSTTWSINRDDSSGKIPSTRLATASSFPSLPHDHERTLSALKSRRTLRQSSSVISERKAYPLPNPTQFEKPASGAYSLSSSLSKGPSTDDILYPVQSYKRFAEREREMAKSSPPIVNPVGTDPQDERPLASISGLKPFAPPDKTPAAATEPVLESPPKELAAKGSRSRVVVVHDAEKKFTTAAVEYALREFAVAEGDAIVVVAFLEHIMSPMGMKMVADLRQFSGVNQTILKQSIFQKTNAIESKLRDSKLLQLCKTKKIRLDARVLPGSNPKALIAKEIIDFQATCAIFDKNAIENRIYSYYKNNLSCHVLRLRSDGRRVETISLFGQGAVVERTGCTTSQCSDSSSDSGSMSSDSPTIWSKLFGSRRSTGSVRHGSGSVMGSSRTSSNLGSSRLSVQDEPVAEVLEKSFSFDSPKPNPAAAYIYAAAGVDHKFGSYTRNRNGESSNLPTALAV